VPPRDPAVRALLGPYAYPGNAYFAQIEAELGPGASREAILDGALTAAYANRVERWHPADIHVVLARELHTTSLHHKPRDGCRPVEAAHHYEAAMYLYARHGGAVYANHTIGNDWRTWISIYACWNDRDWAQPRANPFLTRPDAPEVLRRALLGDLRIEKAHRGYEVERNLARRIAQIERPNR
jgi:hypothetical protein